MKNTLKISLLLASVCSMWACGGKSKKADTVPPAMNSGTDTEDTGPTASTTDTEPVPDDSAKLGSVIYFEFDSTELSEKARDQLNENAAWLKENPERKLTVEGHTDEVGTPNYNLALGERRAQTTKEYLVRLGIEPDRVEIITYGETRPAADDDALNRRSVFIATKK